MIDLVVVGFTGELRALKLQARSIRLYAKPGTFNRIFYVCNDQSFGVFKRYIKYEVLPELGCFKEQVKVVDYKKLAGKRIRKTGWRSQQALKLLAVNIVSTPQFLILDSKNHFIRPIDKATFITPSGKLRVHSVPINELFRKHCIATCHYFGVEHGDKIEEAHPTTTPFMMATAITKGLLTNVEEREEKSFFDVFIENTEWNEFYFYYAYMLSRQGLIETTYDECERYTVALFGQAAESNERVRMLIDALGDTNICCTGVHRRIYEVGLSNNMSDIADMWLRFGLIKTRAEAAYFQTIEKPSKRKRFILF